MSNNGYILRDGVVMDKAEAELHQEIERLGVVNEPVPEECPKCKEKGKLKIVPGMVEEDMLMCEICGDILWCDNVGAIRSVY